MRFELAGWAAAAAAVTLVLAILLAVAVLLLAALSWFARPLRPLAAWSAIIVSYAGGLSLWLGSFGWVLALLGWGWLLVGLLLFGIGVFPCALFTLAMRAEWAMVGKMLLHFAAVLGMRALGLAIGRAYERDQDRAALAQATTWEAP